MSPCRCLEPTADNCPACTDEDEATSEEQQLADWEELQLMRHDAAFDGGR